MFRSPLLIDSKNLQKYYDDDSDVSIRPDYIELYRKES